MKLFNQNISIDTLKALLAVEEDEKAKRKNYNKQYNLKKKIKKDEVYKLAKENNLIK
jgi:hypothetical protein